MSAAFYVPAPLIFAALALDALAGDPPWLSHPVVLIGWAISWGDLYAGRVFDDERRRCTAGSKGRTPTAHAADFPMGLRIRCTLTKEGRAFSILNCNFSNHYSPGPRAQISRARGQNPGSARRRNSKRASIFSLAHLRKTPALLIS
jgi:hypothetical protein